MTTYSDDRHDTRQDVGCAVKLKLTVTPIRRTVLDNQTQQKNMNDLFLFKMHRKHIFIFSQNIKLATPKI